VNERETLNHFHELFPTKCAVAYHSGGKLSPDFDSAHSKRKLCNHT